MTGSTTFDRMSAAAAAEAGHIEIVQAALVEAGIRTEPDRGQLALRDDFDGIVRLIELIKNDTLVLERLTRK
jgi:hypothetical protein